MTAPDALRPAARSPVPVCPVCLGSHSAQFTEANGLDLYSCGECATLFAHPPPGPAETRACYADIENGAPEDCFAKPDKKMRRSRRRVRALWRLAPESRRLLDVGCGGGFIVEAAREAGLMATGVDREPAAIAYARRHFPENDFYCGTVEEFADTAPDRFDIVYCSEVIGHVPDVRSFCRAIAGLLRPGGLLYITTPDLTHWSQPSDVRRRSGFSPPGYCIYFTPRSLIRLLDSCGFELLRKRLAFKPGIKLICRKRDDAPPGNP
jgi:SAM-dependent methyltransferase